MAIRFYLSDITVIERNGRTFNAPRVLLYLTPRPGVMVFAGAGKGVALYLVDTSDAEHAAIQADAAIVAPPLTPATLDTLVTNLPPAWQTAIASWLDNRRIPRDWIDGSTTVRGLLRYLIRLFEVCRDGGIGANYPEVDLAQTVGSLTVAQRQALRAWATARGYDISDITAGTTVRALVRALVERRPGFSRPVSLTLGGVEVVI